jgi:hypothetical protein
VCKSTNRLWLAKSEIWSEFVHNADTREPKHAYASNTECVDVYVLNQRDGIALEETATHWQSAVLFRVHFHRIVQNNIHVFVKPNNDPLHEHARIFVQPQPYPSFFLIHSKQHQRPVCECENRNGACQCCEHCGPSVRTKKRFKAYLQMLKYDIDWQCHYLFYTFRRHDGSVCEWSEMRTSATR